MGASPHGACKQNPRQSRLPEVLFFHGRERETPKPIVANRRIHIGVLACRVGSLTAASKLPELEILQEDIERFHEGNEKSWQAFAITTAEQVEFEKTRLRFQ